MLPSSILANRLDPQPRTKDDDEDEDEDEDEGGEREQRVPDWQLTTEN